MLTIAAACAAYTIATGVPASARATVRMQAAVSQDELKKQVC